MNKQHDIIVNMISLLHLAAVHMRAGYNLDVGFCQYRAEFEAATAASNGTSYDYNAKVGAT